MLTDNRRPGVRPPTLRPTCMPISLRENRSRPAGSFPPSSAHARRIPPGTPCEWAVSAHERADTSGRRSPGARPFSGLPCIACFAWHTPSRLPAYASGLYENSSSSKPAAQARECGRLHLTANATRIPLACASGLDRTAEGGVPEHRSEHQAPRRRRPTIVPNAIAEPPSERSVFGEPARRMLPLRPVDRRRLGTGDRGRLFISGLARPEPAPDQRGHGPRRHPREAATGQQ